MSRVTSTAFVWVMLCCAAFTGCAGSSTERRLLSEHARWRVWISGDLSEAGSLLRDAVVQFSVDREDREFTRGELYRAGGNDRPFDRQFPNHDWVSPNALRLFTSPTGQTVLTAVRIENSAQQPVKWLLLHADEMILALDISPGESMAVPLMQLSERHRFSVKGQFADGATFDNHHSLNVPSDNTVTVRVSAVGSTVEGE
jgi:hypothetical protein